MRQGFGRIFSQSNPPLIQELTSWSKLGLFCHRALRGQRFSREQSTDSSLINQAALEEASGPLRLCVAAELLQRGLRLNPLTPCPGLNDANKIHVKI